MHVYSDDDASTLTTTRQSERRLTPSTCATVNGGAMVMGTLPDGGAPGFVKMTAKLIPLFLMLLAALLVAAGYCLAQIARANSLADQNAGAAFGTHDFTNDPGTRRH